MDSILFATDGSEGAEGARQFLKALPLPAGTKLHVLCVASDVILPIVPIEHTPFIDAAMAEEIYQTDQAHAERVVQEAGEKLAREGLEIITTVRHGNAPHEILLAAEELQADLLVIGPVGHRGLEALMMGSAARNVARHARRPVAVARAPQNGLRHIILAVDESEHAAHAAESAARLPLPGETEFTVVHVIRPYHLQPGWLNPDRERFDYMVEEVRRSREAAGQEIVERERSRLEQAGRKARAEVRMGDPAEEILKAASERGADLIIAGARGASLIEGLLVGSVADRLLNAATCSLLIVH
jgi:nucleotide-binding universal stress UspA family protein